MAATKFDGERSSKNASYVDAVARTNVVLGVAEIHRRSPILETLEKKGDIKIVGRDVRPGNRSRGACRLNTFQVRARCKRSSEAFRTFLSGRSVTFDIALVEGLSSVPNGV